MKRILLAGLLGGVAMYVWTSFAHMALPLGRMGVQEMNDDRAVLAAMKTAIGGNAGFYYFPSTGAGSNATRQQVRDAMKDYDAKLAANPSGILVYTPPGGKMMDPSQLVFEFLKELALSLIAACLLAKTNLARYVSRLGFVAAIGIVAASSTNISYWNWYHFPADYTAGVMIIGFLSFVSAGLVIAAMVKPAAEACIPALSHAD